MPEPTTPSASPPGTDPDGGRSALTELVLAVFRLNGDLLAAGDALVHDLGLTSARWQVLGAVALSPVPLPVAHIARNMGLTRQAVQRVVDDLHAAGFLRVEPNPHHRRAHLIALTGTGESAYREAIARKEVWFADLCAGLPPDGIAAAASLLREIQRRIGAAAQDD
ncbi:MULTISPECIES: MarR family winged helix-turn-helix transcriptional regulator [Methylobacterium]|uniref:MarR family transcriptional regulator n=2 Tax=Methylobacterium TaxID=407 RepID=A0A0C6FP08_9HYPH|nr:MarR family transcriptional regulator [Methylobacterium aquaticum]BAQ47014.1 MarR family transcriptional regulator [Methylobacterium aquaticum]